jgi:phenylalanyl-tRNA synthetase beta chain
VAALIGCDDHVVEFEITPNRPDCLSVIGLAREAAATFHKPLKLHTPVIRGCGGSIAELVDIDIEDGDLCPRYTARMVKNVKIAPSPAWMRERLRNSGVRPINNIVDITNYVMLEYGQPMHAFDFSCVEGGHIIVRTAREGETIQTLDGKDHGSLTPGMLCICDEHRPVCVAGVMGGANSEIVGDTAQVLFESANFNGASVRRTAVALGMRTEASSRYEKGLDPMNTMKAVQRACELVELLGCGEVVDGVLDVIARDAAPTVRLEPEKINALLGTDVARDEMVRILEKLEFTVEGDTIRVPSWRGDVEGCADIAEEVARFHGYNKIPVTLMAAPPSGAAIPRCSRRSSRWAPCAAPAATARSSPTPSSAPPITTRSTCRRTPPCGTPENSQSPGRGHLHHAHHHPALHAGDSQPQLQFPQQERPALRAGPRVLPPGPTAWPTSPRSSLWAPTATDMDFFALKGAVETVLEGLRISGVTYEAEHDNPSYHPGRCARAYSGDRCWACWDRSTRRWPPTTAWTRQLYAAELRFAALFDMPRRPAPSISPCPDSPPSPGTSPWSAAGT